MKRRAGRARVARRESPPARGGGLKPDGVRARSIAQTVVAPRAGGVD